MDGLGAEFKTKEHDEKFSVYVMMSQNLYCL